MCGRYVLYGPPSAIAAEAGLELAPFDEREWRPRFNVAPSQAMPIVVAGEHPGDPDRLIGASWGFVPGWVRDRPKLRPINARVEAVFEKPYFRSALRAHRCLVPANAWYEWKPIADGKQPYAIGPRTRGAGFFFAGLWADAEVTGGPNFAILTGPALASIAGIHDRMPLALPPAAGTRWLHPDTADPAYWRGWLADAVASLELHAWPVSRAVNAPRNDEPRLLDPVPEPTRGA
jgi:putative SOS response-associated peptidase YedK